MPCICGHAIEDHSGNGTCQVPGCLCCGYEEDEDDEGGMGAGLEPPAPAPLAGSTAK